MKIRDALFLVIGGLLVISGMVLNSVLVGDANADKGSIDAKFGEVTCRKLIIKDGDEIRAVLGLDRTNLASLSIFDIGDGSHHRLAYLGTEKVYDEEVIEKGKVVGKKKVVGRGDTRLDLFSEYNPNPSNLEWYSIDEVLKKLDLIRSKFFEMIEKGELPWRKN